MAIATRCASVVYDPGDLEHQNQATISHTFLNENMIGHSERPVPLRMYYVGKIPLNEALRTAQYVRADSHLGRACEVFRFSNVRWAMRVQDLVYYLDKETAVPLKMEAFAGGGGDLLWVWEATALERVEGRLFPMRSKTTSTDARTGDKSEMDHEVVSLAFDGSYPTSTFWRVLQPGVTVLDAIEQKEYQVPDPAAEAAGPSTIVGLEAKPPGEWTDFAAPAGLGIGIVLLLACAFVWWRRH